MPQPALNSRCSTGGEGSAPDAPPGTRRNDPGLSVNDCHHGGPVSVTNGDGGLLADYQSPKVSDRLERPQISPGARLTE